MGTPSSVRPILTFLMATMVSLMVSLALYTVPYAPEYTKNGHCFTNHPYCGSQKGGHWMEKIMYTVRKCKCWRYCLARCNEIFAFFPLFDETLRHIELCNNVIRHIQRNPPKHFFNTVVMYSLKSGSTRKDSYFFKLKFIIATWLIFFASLLIPYNTTQWTLACK